MKLPQVTRLRRTLGAAACVRERMRFVGRELRGVRSEHGYRLRGSGLTAQIRHPLLDMWVLEEIFRFGAYEPPEQVIEAMGPLGGRPRILDLGGHVGLFALSVLTRFEYATVVSLEPDPRNAPVLRRCIEANGLGHRWRLVEACAATREGPVEFESDFHLSGVAGRGGQLAGKHAEIGDAFGFMQGTPLMSSERHVVQARDVLPLTTEADLLKIDIEGGEWEILADPRFADTSAIAVVLEYHAAYTDEPDARGAARGLLAEAGFETLVSRDEGGAGVIWAWR
ncbi:MAG: FkbM family methyltransferase [Thermoleophilaceae bacterium]|nr:FkbM family methyltransferase [Thermoleophilaceae bacterium]